MDSQKNPNLETTHHLILPMDSRKNPNLETTPNHAHHVQPSPASSSQDFKTTHDHDNHGLKKTREDDQGIINNNAYDMIKKPSSSCSSLAAGSGQGDARLPTQPQEMVVVEESGREKLERHRVEMAGRVWIPDIWGQEDLLKDLIDCTVFDSSLGNSSIMSARSALVQEERSRSTLRIENRC